MRLSLDDPPNFRKKPKYGTIAESNKVGLGERRLMVAVMEDAFTAYCKYKAAKNPRGRQFFLQAKEWFEADDPSWLFSFRNICEALGLDPQSIRRAIKNKRAGEAPEDIAERLAAIRETSGD